MRASLLRARARAGFGLTDDETWSVGRLRWRWGQDCSSCILQIREIHRLYTQDGLFNIAHYPGHDCRNWGSLCYKCVCGMMSEKGTFFFLVGNRSINFSPHFLM